MLSEGIEVKRIGDLLIEKGLINPQQLEEALEYQKKYGGRLGWILASLGYIKRLDFYKTLAEHYKLEFIEDRDRIVSLIDPNLIKNFDPQELSTHELIPAKVDENEVLILTSNPLFYSFELYVLCWDFRSRLSPAVLAFLPSLQR